LGIAALEDKIVQQAVVTVLTAIYETDFLGFSYGFRPGRSQHQALDALWNGINARSVNWVLDTDIKAFFDTIDHGWMMRFLEHRVADRRILRLIRKWLNAGTNENGVRTAAQVGTPQGAVISPLLANVYLHYVFDLWTHRWRRREAKGDAIVIRYADDSVVGFEFPGDARAYLDSLRTRPSSVSRSMRRRHEYWSLDAMQSNVVPGAGSAALKLSTSSASRISAQRGGGTEALSCGG
jgi:group II intron reverse transcriptase/maturase